MRHVDKVEFWIDPNDSGACVHSVDTRHRRNSMNKRLQHTHMFYWDLEVSREIGVRWEGNTEDTRFSDIVEMIA